MSIESFLKKELREFKQKEDELKVYLENHQHGTPIQGAFEKVVQACSINKKGITLVKFRLIPALEISHGKRQLPRQNSIAAANLKFIFKCYFIVFKSIEN